MSKLRAQSTVTKNDIVKYLRCPICGTAMQKKHNILSCNTGHTFPIRDDVPAMLPTEQSTGVKCTGDVNVKSTYDYKWKALPQYGYDAATEKFRYEWYLERYGWEAKELGIFLRSCETVLDVGTGLGSQAKMYAGLTTGDVFGIDISDSVYAASRYQSSIPNVHFIQADLHHLPFPQEAFDFIVSDQVLHHTPDTELAIRSLVPLLKKGGQLAFYVYRRKGELREKCDDFLRQFTTRMSENDCLKFSDAMTRFGRGLSEINVETQRAIYWGMLKCFWNPDLDYKTNVMVNFDWYHPRYAWRHTADEVREWLLAEDLDVLYLDEGDSGISVRAMKKVMKRAMKRTTCAV